MLSIKCPKCKWGKYISPDFKGTIRCRSCGSSIIVYGSPKSKKVKLRGKKTLWKSVVDLLKGLPQKFLV